LPLFTCNRHPRKRVAIAKTASLLGPERSARGMGREVALQFADRGANVALFDLDAAELAETTKLCIAKSVQAREYRVNVADEGEVTEAMTCVSAEFGRLDGLVNNAGIVRDGLDGGLRL
jgi:3-oxoacyl-[acyl-carrier protein] reductase